MRKTTNPIPSSVNTKDTPLAVAMESVPTKAIHFCPCADDKYAVGANKTASAIPVIYPKNGITTQAKANLAKFIV